MPQERPGSEDPSRGPIEDSAFDRLLAQIRAWRDALVNLNRRSRLLYFRESRRSSFRIVKPEIAELLALIPDAKSAGAGIWEPPDKNEPPAGPEEEEIATNIADGASLRQILRNLERRSTQEDLEKGIWILYVAIGFLDWNESPEERVSSPILFVPVKLSRDGPKSQFQLSREESDPSVNPALTIKLESDFGIVLPSIEDLDEEDPDAFLRAVEEAVKPQEGWAVRRDVLVSTFSFHKEAMYRDLLDNEEVISAHAVVRAIVMGPNAGIDLSVGEISDEEIDSQAPPEEVATILDADASQRRALAAATAGHSFIMDGPPGTGKSQTIANLIAELLRQGKRVLFVSEKIAALEVVRKRLRAAGLGDLTLELHSHKATRREVARSLGHALRSRTRPGAELPASDLVALQRTRKELTDYCRALNESRPDLQRTLHSVLGEIASLQHLPQAPHPVRGGPLTTAELSGIQDAAARLGRAWGPVADGPRFVWRGTTLRRLDERLRFDVRSRLTEASRTLSTLREASRNFADELGLSPPDKVADALALASLATCLASKRGAIDARWLTSRRDDAVVAAIEVLAEAASRIDARGKALVGDAGCEAGVFGRADREVIERLLTSLRADSLDAAGLESAGESRLRTLMELLRATADQVAASDVLASEIASAMSANPGAARLEETTRLALVAVCCAPKSVPDPAWLEPAVLAEVRRAAAALEKASGAHKSIEASAAAVFLPSILEVDLEPLRLRFEKLHRGAFKFFHRKYWADRTLLARCTVEQRATPEAIRHLQAAIDWKSTRRELRKKEELHGRALGRFYDGDATDFSDLNSAIEAAEALVSAKPDYVATNSLAAVIANPRVASEALRRGRHLRQVLDEIDTCLSAGLPPSCAEVIRREPLRDAVAALRGMAAAIAEVVSRLAQLDAARKGRPSASACELLRWSDWKSELDSLVAAYRREESLHAPMLGDVYHGIGTDWQALRAGAEWVKEAKRLAGGEAPPGREEVWLHPTGQLTQVLEAAATHLAARSAVASLFEPPYDEEKKRTLDGSFDEVARHLGELDERVNDIEDWGAHLEAFRALTEEGFAATLSFCVDARVDHDAVEPIVRRSVLEAWSDEILSLDPRLKNARREERDQAVRRFQELDRKLIKASAARVIAACNSRMPSTLMGAAAVIAREAEKEKRHMPVRRLLEEAGEVALSLKPCFMMSPLSVSQFLPSRLHFDVVVFDEASQVRPEDSINSVYRGSQLVLAGDQKQLPPTSFFELADDGTEEWEEDQLEDFTSVLDLAKASGQVPSVPLQWHYRSQHEDLITFSNYSFYGGRLLTFPSAHAGGGDLGVELIRIDGVYRRGGARDNPIEAAAVVGRVLHHLRQSPGRTIGVVAFSDAQANAIEAALELKAKDVPELRGIISDDRLDGFFVKNLESVQGDDRDIIIFSVGYGPDENGRLSLNFGPINRKGGERRLNVAITRARRRLEVISSISAEDIRMDVASEGMKHLRRYLDFAARPANRVQALATDLGPSGLDVESPFEDEVARVIRSWGFSVVPQVGCAEYRIDLGVVHPGHAGQYVLGVECDGAACSAPHFG